MGQYYYIVNIDKKQFLHPHDFGDGLKLLEFGSSGCGTMTALAVLLADGNGRGGGDLHSDNPIVGSWAGDRIVIAGDYADPGNFLPPNMDEEEKQKIANECFSEGYRDPAKVNLHGVAKQTYENISERVISALQEDSFLAEEMRISV